MKPVMISIKKNADDIYQIGTEFIGLGNFKKLPNTPAAMGEMMKETFPEVIQSTRLTGLYSEDKTSIHLLENQQARSFSDASPGTFIPEYTLWCMRLRHAILK